MGFREALGRWRTPDGDGARRPHPETPQTSRHQADPVTGELRRVTDAGPPSPRETSNGYSRYYTPPPSERRRRARATEDVPPPYYGAAPVYGPPTDRPGPAEPAPVADHASVPDVAPVDALAPDVAPIDAPVFDVAPVRDPTPVEPAPLVETEPAAQPPAAQPPAAQPPAARPPVARTTGGLVLGRAERGDRRGAMPAFYAPTPKPYDRSEVRRAFDLVADRSDRLVRDFYAELFVLLGDDAFAMFPSSMEAQREDFGRALVQWVVTDDPDAMATHLAQLGADHRKFDVEPMHYDLAGQALVNAWRNLAGAGWTPATEAAITASYTRLASVMIDGAQRHDAEPRWWSATVVAHERVLPDCALVTLQPEAPYPFRPGQYLTIEIASHGRQWRQMSIASAPRPDNTIDLQVRAVNATGVAAGLVMHTRTGDRVRLGPPRGTDLVVDPASIRSGLLCVGSGTGAAPISAVVQAVSARDDHPPVHVFVGVRRAADLFAVDQLTRRLHDNGRGDRIQVTGVVSDDPTWTGLRGRVEDVVPTLKDWAQLDVDVLVAGPDTMMANTIRGLTERGVAPGRIRFDQYETPA